MDQLKTFLTTLKRYHFWILCGVVIVTTAACWWMATAGLADQYQSRKKAIDDKFKGLVIDPNHPNQAVIDKTRDRDTALQENVHQAWEVLYDQQKKNNPIPAELGEEFKQAFKRVENVNLENLTPKDEIPEKYREVYQNYIRRHFPTWLAMVDALRPAAGGEDQSIGPGGGPAPPTDQPMIGVVDWNRGDYQRLVSRFDWGLTPSTADIILRKRTSGCTKRCCELSKTPMRAPTRRTPR